MKTFKIELLSDSRINKLPDAQTIFGAICYIYINLYGEKKFDEYIDSFKTEPLFVHSSLMPSGLYPMFKQNLFSIEFVNSIVLNGSANEQLNLLNKMKSYKKIQYISELIYKDYVLSGNINQLSQNLVKNETDYKIENGILQYVYENKTYSLSKNMLTRVKTDLMDLENGKDRDLFYDMDFYFEQGQAFTMFVKSNQTIEYIKNIFDKLDYFPLGNRGSVGKNLFKFNGIQEVESNSVANLKMLLSKCIPVLGEMDYLNSSYALNHASYRTSKGYQNRLVGQLTKLTEGSLVKVKEDKEYCGRVIEFDNHGNKIYHYGIGFVF